MLFVATTLQDQGKLAEAEPLYQRSLAIGEKTLGPDHPKVATWLNNLAALWRVRLQPHCLCLCIANARIDHLSSRISPDQAQGELDDAETKARRACGMNDQAHRWGKGRHLANGPLIDSPNVPEDGGSWPSCIEDLHGPLCVFHRDVTESRLHLQEVKRATSAADAARPP